MSTVQKILLPICSVAVIFSIFCLTLTAVPQRSDKTRRDTGISAENIHYTVKNLDGKIAVFEGDSETALFTLETPLIKDLPEYDRDLLEVGITVDSCDKLLQLLEDYDS